MRPVFLRSPVCLIPATVCVWFLLIGVPVRAQETINSASVGGRVTDPQNAVIPGAVVVAKQTATNVQAEAVTDRDGRFRFPYLKVGTYEITVHVQGFSTATRILTLTVGSAFDLTFPLSLESVNSVINVTSDATVLEA